MARAPLPWDISRNGEPSLRDQVDQVPTDPGCYLWKNAQGTVCLLYTSPSPRDI